MTNFIFGRGFFGRWIFAGPTGEGAGNSDRGKVHEYYPGQFVVYFRVSIVTRKGDSSPTRSGIWASSPMEAHTSP